MTIKQFRLMNIYHFILFFAFAFTVRVNSNLIKSYFSIKMSFSSFNSSLYLLIVSMKR